MQVPEILPIYTCVSRMVRQRTVNPWRKQLDVRSVPRVPFQMPDSYSGRLRLICNQEHFVPHSFESNIRLSFLKQDWQRSYAPPLQGGFYADASSASCSISRHLDLMVAANISRCSIVARYSSGQRVQTVNLPASAFGGSNPPLATNFRFFFGV